MSPPLTASGKSKKKQTVSGTVQAGIRHAVRRHNGSQKVALTLKRAKNLMRYAGVPACGDESSAIIVSLARLVLRQLAIDAEREARNGRKRVTIKYDDVATVMSKRMGIRTSLVPFAKSKKSGARKGKINVSAQPISA
jgi:histone H3/H4